MGGTDLEGGWGGSSRPWGRREIGEGRADGVHGGELSSQAESTGRYQRMKVSGNVCSGGWGFGGADRVHKSGGKSEGQVESVGGGLGWWGLGGL